MNANAWNRGTRRTFLGTLGATAFAGTALAQDRFPSKPVKWIVGFPPGGGTDTLARTVGQSLAGKLGQQVIIDNRPGASGMLAAELTARSASDGYTLFTADVSLLVFQPVINAQARYDPDKDFSLVSLLARFPFVLATHPGSGIKTVTDYVAVAKADPKKLSFGTAGYGTPHHLAMELFLARAGIEAQHVPYKGDAPALQDLAGAQVATAMLPPSLSLPYFASGKLVPLAVTGDARLPQLPNTPTLKELNLTTDGVYAWQGLVAPRNVNPATIDVLATGVQAVLADPAVQRRLADLGMEPMTGGTRAMAELFASEKNFWRPLIKARNIRVE